MRKQLLITLSCILLLIIGNGYSMGKSPAMEHRITYSHKDTRSESKHGHLFINGVEIPDVFTLVISRDGAYRFHRRQQLWGMDGYFPAEKAADIFTVKESSTGIGAEATSRGWYEGKEKLAGTPDEWLYVEWEEGSVFLSPDKIKDFVSARNLKTIPRWEAPVLRK